MKTPAMGVAADVDYVCADEIWWGYTWVSKCVCPPVCAQNASFCAGMFLWSLRTFFWPIFVQNNSEIIWRPTVTILLTSRSATNYSFHHHLFWWLFAWLILQSSNGFVCPTNSLKLRIHLFVMRNYKNKSSRCWYLKVYATNFTH